VHMDYCEQCRHEVRELTSLGAGLFDSLDPVPVAESSLGDLLDRIELEDSVELQEGMATPQAGNTAADKFVTAGSSSNDGIPSVLTSMLPNGLEDLDWKRITRVLSVCRLAFGDQQREVALHHIREGGKVASHSHTGNEATVVLKGSFSDCNGAYQEGDFIYCTPEDTHRPVAAEDGDCICLSVLDAPIKLDGMWSQMLNPFMRLRPG